MPFILFSGSHRTKNTVPFYEHHSVTVTFRLSVPKLPNFGNPRLCNQGTFERVALGFVAVMSGLRWFDCIARYFISLAVSCESLNHCSGQGDCVGSNVCTCHAGFKGLHCSEGISVNSFKMDFVGQKS